MVRFDGGVWLPLVQAATSGATPTTVTSGDLSLAAGSTNSSTVIFGSSTVLTWTTAGQTDCVVVAGASGPSNAFRWADRNPGNMCSTTPTTSWTYITSSDNPYICVVLTGSTVTTIWQAEDPPGVLPVAGCLSVGPPPVAILTGLYAADTVASAAREALSAVLDERGWLGDDSTVSTMIADVPRDGCGTPDGDCRPAARLHALRALAEANGESVFALVARETRISPAGAWSVAP